MNQIKQLTQKQLLAQEKAARKAELNKTIDQFHGSDDALMERAKQYTKAKYGTEEIFLVTVMGDPDTQIYVRPGASRTVRGFIANDKVIRTPQRVKTVLAASTERTRKLTAAYAYDMRHGTRFYADLKAKYAAEDNAAFAEKLGL